MKYRPSGSTSARRWIRTGSVDASAGRQGGDAIVRSSTCFMRRRRILTPGRPASAATVWGPLTRFSSAPGGPADARERGRALPRQVDAPERLGVGVSMRLAEVGRPLAHPRLRAGEVAELARVAPERL